MNVLIVNYLETTSPGGINKVVKETAKKLYGLGCRVTVLQPNPSNLPEEEICEGFRIIRVYSKTDSYFYGLNLKIWMHLKHILKSTKPDIIHIHGYHTLFSPEVFFLIKKIDPNIRLIFSPHFDLFSHDTFAGKYLWNQYNNLIGTKITKFPYLICAASNFEAKNIHNILGVPENKIKVIPHGVDVIEVNDKLKKNKKLIHILYVGYLLELKGIQHIVKALNELVNEKKVNAKLTIVGKGPYEQNLKELAHNLGVDKNIDWKGFVSSPDLINEYKKADVFILASMSENYGIVVTEALALGTPVIVTKRTALSEFLDEPGCFGIDYPPEPSKLSELILEITSTNIKVGPFSDKIRTWAKVTDDYEKLYEKVTTMQKTSVCE
jgi:glycosyltransferase involved in cell wall biosynthesis